MTTVAQTLSRSDRLASSSARMLLLLLRARAALVLVLLVITFSVLTPVFFTTNNLAILSKHVAISALLAIGMTFTILTGGIDLSVGSVAGLGGIVAGYLIAHGVIIHGVPHYPSTPVVIILAILVCLIIGLLNGWLIARAAVPPFIATLGTMYIARGTALLISSGKTFPGISVPVWLTVFLFASAAFIARKMPIGRHIYAIGGNERAARLAGINVPRVKVFTYLFSAACAGLVGLIIASQLEAAHPATGESFELNAIAAVVLGGTSLMGGRGSITGSLIGALVIGVLADGLVMLGVSEFWQIVITGVVIVVAVAIDQLQTRVQARLLPYLLRSNPEAGA
jgi:erythritol transport system permease protein